MYEVECVCLDEEEEGEDRRRGDRRNGKVEEGWGGRESHKRDVPSLNPSFSGTRR